MEFDCSSMGMKYFVYSAWKCNTCFLEYILGMGMKHLFVVMEMIHLPYVEWDWNHSVLIYGHETLGL